MKKSFCDICGKEAHVVVLSAKRPHGDPHTTYRDVSPSVVQCSIWVNASFSFENSKTSETTPDLCSLCKVELLGQLVAQLVEVKR